MSRERLEQLRKKKRLAELRAKQIDRDTSAAVQQSGGGFDVGGPIDPIPISDIYPKTSAALENTASLVTSAAAQPVAGLVGLGQTLNPLADSGAGSRTVRQVQDALTYRPRSGRAQQNQSQLAELMHPVAEVVDKARLGDETLEAGLPRSLATFNEMLPEVAGSMVGLKGLGVAKPPKPPIRTDKAGNVLSGLSKKQQAGVDLRFGKPTGRTAPFKLEAGKVVKDSAAKSALSQGWDDATVSGVKAANSATKSKLRKMIDVARGRTPERATIESKILTRPSDVAGESLMQRYQFIKGANNSAGKQLTRIAKEQGAKGVKVDVTSPMQYLRNQFGEMGIRISSKGKVDFSGSKLAKSDHGLIKENIRHILRIMKSSDNGRLNFQQAHELKQIMRRTGLSYKQTVAKTGASPETQAMFKGFSSKIDEVLDTQSKAYDNANIKFGDTRDVMDKIEKIARDNLFTESADTQLGVLTRRLMGNPVSRGSIIDMAKSMDATAQKYGGKFQDDLFTQSWVAHDMDDVLQVAAKTSLKGESGGQAMVKAMDRSNVGRVAQILDAAAHKIGGKSEIKALDSLQALIRE